VPPLRESHRSDDLEGSGKSCSADCEHANGWKDSFQAILHSDVSPNGKDKVDRQAHGGSSSDFVDSETGNQSCRCCDLDQAENSAQVGRTTNCFSRSHDAR